MQLVTLGGAALRLTPPGNERLETARRLEVGVTGAECSAAVAAERLGSETAWISRLPDSALGRRVATEIRGHDVEVLAEYADGRQGLSFFERGTKPRTNARLDDFGSAAVDGLTMDDVPTDRVESADIAYVTSATPRTSTGVAGATAKFLKTAMDAEATTALGLFDTRGWSDVDSARDTLEGLFPAVDVFVATADAVEAVFDREGEAGPVMHALASNHGFETVALTREHTTAAWHDSTIHEFVPPDVDTVDVTGAVDAFAGAFLARLDDEEVGSALRTATAAEALVKTTPGALPVFTAAEVKQVAADIERP